MNGVFQFNLDSVPAQELGRYLLPYERIGAGHPAPGDAACLVELLARVTVVWPFGKLITAKAITALPERDQRRLLLAFSAYVLRRAFRQGERSE